MMCLVYYIAVKLKVDNALHIIVRVRHLTGSTYVMRFSRNGMEFVPGQYLFIGLPGSARMREYSIYSGVHDDFLEILIKEVDEGEVSRELKTILPGEKLEVRGPYGSFLREAPEAAQGKRLFISSGTGIAPFHSFIMSYPGLDYRLIHGVRIREEAYDYGDYRGKRVILCTSRDRGGDFYGRVTDYLRENVPGADQQVYLCGSGVMIHDAMEIIQSGGVPQNQMFTEVYF